MSKYRSVSVHGFFTAALAGLLLFASACTEDRPMTADPLPVEPGKVLGVSFESLQVSDLQRSIDYYQTLGFSLAGESDPPWIKNEAANRLYNTPGAMSRTATLTIDSTASGQPFTLFLCEYKDIERRSRAEFPARAPSSSHIGLRVPESDDLWAQLESDGLLRSLSWEGKLIRMPGQESGGLAYIKDPDGYHVEIIGISPQPPETAEQDMAALK